jgi:hypothetical protein
MRLLFLDLARRTGYAYGRAGQIPTSGSLTLRDVDDSKGLAIGALGRWLSDLIIAEGPPDLIGIERWLPPKISRNAVSTEDALRMNGCIHGIAGIYGINIVEPYPATIRSAVCGRSHAAGENDIGTKRMVIDTMILRKYIPKGCEDHDRADACAGFAWMEAYCVPVGQSKFKLM